MLGIKTPFTLLAFIGLVLGLVALAGYFQPCKYHLGMTLTEARLLMDQPYQQVVMGLDYAPAGPSPKQMAEDIAYMIYDENGGVMLGFNRLDKIVEIRRGRFLGIDFFKVIRFIKACW